MTSTGTAAAASSEEFIDFFRFSVPLKTTGHILEIDLEEEWLEMEELPQIFKDEQVPRESYWKFAVACYKKGLETDFIKLLEAGSGGADHLKEWDKTRQMDKLKLNYSFAAFCYKKAFLAPTKDLKEQLTQQAETKISEFERTDYHNIELFYVKALRSMVQENYLDAKNIFENILPRAASSISKKYLILILLGKAHCSFHLKDYKGALKLYQDIYRMNPLMQPDVRIGIGLCFFKLGDLDKALYAFERVLKRDPENMMVYVYAAVTLFNQAKLDLKSPESVALIKKAVSYLTTAHKKDKNNVFALIYLADIMCQKKDYEKSLKIANTCLSSSLNKEIMRLAYLYIARVEHVQEKFEDSQRDYLKSSAIDEVDETRYGLAQLKLPKKMGHELAVADFEDIVRKSNHPNADGKKILAYCYSRFSDKRDKAKELYLELAGLDPEDDDVWVRLAELHGENGDFIESSDAFSNAASAFYKKQNQFSAELINNLAVSKHHSGDFEAAENYYLKALGFAEQARDADRANWEGIVVLINYNIARLHEDMYERNTNPELLEKAVKGYKAILEEHPGYIDAKMRLGWIAEKTGKLSDAIAIYKECTKIDEANADVYTCIGNLEFKKKQYRNAKHAFEKILKNINEKDIYSMLALGNERLESGRGEQKADARNGFYKEAFKSFERVIRKQPACIYAANGIGIALLGMGKYSDARDVFSQVRETNEDVLQFQLNYAHCLVELGQYVNAVAVYESLGEKQGAKDLNLTLFTARAYYIMGKLDKQPSALKNAIRLIQDLIIAKPEDLALSFNLALCYQQYAQIVYEQDQPENLLSEENHVIEELNEALTLIDEAKRMFGDLKGKKDARNHGYDAQLASQREKHCDFVRNNVSRKLTKIKANEEMHRENIEKLKKLREVELAKKAEKEQEELRLKLEREEQLIEERKKFYEQFAEEEKLRAEQTSKAPKKEKEKKKRKKRKEESEEDDDGEEPRDEETPVESSSKKKKKTRFEVPDDEDEQKPSSTKGSQKGRKSSLSEEIIEDSDDEDKDNAEEEVNGQPSAEDKPEEPLAINKKAKVINDSDDE